MSTPVSDPKLFDIACAVVYLQSLGAQTATTNFVRTLVLSGQVPHLRIGRKFYIAKTALDTWIETRGRRTR